MILLSPRRVSPFLAWGDFHARSRFARSAIPEDKWGTTRSLCFVEVIKTSRIISCNPIGPQRKTNHVVCQVLPTELYNHMSISTALLQTF